jgi:photosystem II stability/assembly factor-like uncharacterized protein
MKTKIYFLAIIMALGLTGKSQFIPQTINYPGLQGISYYPDMMSIVDQNHVWLGTEAYSNTNHMDSSFTIAYKTSDGGTTWQSFSIPAGDTSLICSVSAPDINTAYYGCYNMAGASGIWKTTDGGTTWVKKTTTQFSNGGWLDFCYAFSADTVVAMGDPNGGFFEIYTSNDGGNSWSRVPSANIPAPVANEFGQNSGFGVYGNTIWFTTNKGRCYRSTDHGWTWSLMFDAPPPNGWWLGQFSTQQKGVLYNANNPFYSPSIFFRTQDGGTTWTADSIDANYSIGHIAAVPGLDGAFIFTVFDAATFTNESVWYTPDLFNTIEVIDSNVMQSPWANVPAPGALSFFNASTGWLCGNGNSPDYIYKFNDVLTSTSRHQSNLKDLGIFPNPSTANALVRLPAGVTSDLLLRIVDLTGKVVGEKSVDSQPQTLLDASRYSNGIYIVELYSGNSVVARQKWVVQH